jgi:DNA-binding CsgD family transcriptional regulator
MIIRMKVQSLTGRESELRVLFDLIEAAPKQGGALVVRGEPGVGKSALLKEASAYASEQKFRLLDTTGVQSEARIAFAGLHQVLHPILEGLDRLPAPQRGALRSAFGMDEGSAPDIFLVALAALELLSEAAAKTPIAVIVEDAHWLDRPTVDALTFVARRVHEEPILLLFAVREGFESRLAHAGLSQMMLTGLDEHEAAELLDLSAPEIPSKVRGRILKEAEGNPLALVELPLALGSLDEEEILTSPPIPITERLEHAFSARTSDLSIDSRALLLVAAVNDGDSVQEVLSAASIMRGASVSLDALASAVAARLVDFDGTSLRFHHPLVRSAIYQSASIPQRQAAHAALADVLVDQPERRVWQRASSILGTDEEVAAELEDAARRAELRGATTVALVALERAASLTGDATARGGRLLRAAELAIDLGKLELVVRLLRQVESIELSKKDLARRAWIREMADPGLPGDIGNMRSLVDAAERMSAEGETDLALKLLWAAASSGYWAGRGHETWREIVDAAEKIPVPRDHPWLISVFAYAAPLERGELVFERLSYSVLDRNADPTALGLLGNAAATVGAFDLSEPFVTASAARLREQGKLAILAQVLVLLAWCELHLGRWDAATADAEEAVRLALETSQPIWAAGARAGQSMLAGLRGNEAEAEELALEAEAVALPIGARAVLSVVQLARGLTALAAGRHSDAFAQLQRLFDPADPSHHPMESCWAIGNLVEAAVQSGHTEEARSIVGELEPLAARTPSPWFHVAMRHARALLADDDQAEARFQDGLDADLSRWPLDRARLLLAYGQWLRRQRRIAESRAPLRAARDAFDALGVVAWAERARQELRASGETSRERTPVAWDRLTPQELQIARMASGGLSNREIAQQLYLSHRTVSSHLYRIFPKLGVSSRSQLAAALRGH